MDTVDRFSVKKIDNAFIVDYATTNEEETEYTSYKFAYLSIDGVIEKLQEVFHQDGK